MGAETPGYFCPNCLCPGCVAVSRALWENQQRAEAEAVMQQAEIRNKRDREYFRRLELMQQGAMIWMLTNHAKDSAEAFAIMNELAIALDVSPAMVNARRKIYVTELNRRAGIYSDFQWKPPGSRGTDEPSWCPTCGGLKTKGRRCARKSCR